MKLAFILLAYIINSEQVTLLHKENQTPVVTKKDDLSQQAQCGAKDLQDSWGTAGFQNIVEAQMS